jgi:hypothetical protein
MVRYHYNNTRQRKQDNSIILGTLIAYLFKISFDSNRINIVEIMVMLENATEKLLNSIMP